MIRALLCYLCLCAYSVAAFAQQTNEAGRLWFNVTLEPEFVVTKGAYVGGEIVMHVQFISSDPFKRLRLDLPIIEGVRSDVLARPHTRQIEILGDEGYNITGSMAYSHEARLAIVPTQSGTIVIPPITVTGISEPGNVPNFNFKEVYPEQTIIVHPRNPDFVGDAWIVSRNVTMQESWSHEISEIQNGDTVRRTVTLTVAGNTADDLPELILGSNDGHRVLNTEVSTETEKTDAGFTAHLVQSWDIYVVTEDVTYIDGVRLPYWNPELEISEEVAVARQRVEPLKRDAIALRQTLREEALGEHRAKRLGLSILLSLPAAALIIFAVLVFWRALPTKADLRFWRASRQTDEPLKFYGSFLSWGQHTFGSRTAVGQAQVSALGARATDQVRGLHGSIFGRLGGDLQTTRIAATLIWASRRMMMTRFMSAIVPSISRFLFLR